MFNFEMFKIGFIQTLITITTLLCILGPVLLGLLTNSYWVLLLYIITLPIGVGFIVEDTCTNS
jgi:hypothetical protein